MVWASAGIGLVVGALLMWGLVRLGFIYVGMVGNINLGPISCASSSRVRVPFEAFPAGDELDEIQVRGATYQYGGSLPSWDDCSASASVSPMECDIGAPNHDRVVVYGAFKRVTPPATSPLPSCSSSSGSSSKSGDSSQQPSVLP
jgi:hypothetical protein